MAAISIHTQDPISPARGHEQPTYTPRSDSHAYASSLAGQHLQSSPLNGPMDSQSSTAIQERPQFDGAYDHTTPSHQYRPSLGGSEVVNRPRRGDSISSVHSVKHSRYQPVTPSHSARPSVAERLSPAQSPLPPPPKVGESFNPASLQQEPRFLGPSDANSPAAIRTNASPFTSRQASPVRSPLVPAASTFTGGCGGVEHPSGYVQNPYATDMTPAQRLAAELEAEKSGEPDALGFIERRPRAGSAASLLTDVGESLHGAKKWMQQLGGEVSDRMNEMVREHNAL